VDVLDLYLGAVRGNLPQRQQDDIIRELSESLRERMDDREAELGRPLSDAEQDEILREHGHPMVVAARYRGDDGSLRFGRQLIGPELFPLYARVLGINAAITVLIGIGFVASTLAGWELAPSLYGLAVPLVLQFAIVTGIFVVIDRRLAHEIETGTWNPRNVWDSTPVDAGTGLDAAAYHLLGRAHDAHVPRRTSAAELAMASVALVWWVAISQVRDIGFVAIGPGLTSLYLPGLVLFIASVIPPIVHLARPDLTAFRYAARAAIDVAYLVLIAGSLQIGEWVVASDDVTRPADAGTLIELINDAVRIGLAVAFAITLVMVVLEVRRLVVLLRSRSDAGVAPG
jgi:hypothetical protein